MERIDRDPKQLKAVPVSRHLEPDDLDDDDGLDLPDRSMPGPAVLPPAKPARWRPRHVAVFASFALCVLLPVAAFHWYLTNRAADQYASTVAFTVRTEDGPMGLEVISFVTAASGGNMSNADILYQFIRSQQLVAAIDERLGLRRLYAKPDNDPLFAFDASGSIEDLVEYWGRMVRVSFEADTGLLEIRALAFTRHDAQAVAQAIYDESSIMINGLSRAAQEDATRAARVELDLAVERLKVARQALTVFRSETQIVDPNVDLTGQMGVLNSLQAQLAEALIELDLLQEVTTRSGDPRLDQARRRISAIEERIADEKRKLSSGAAEPGDRTFTQIMGRFEELLVDRQFAEESYLSARAGYDAALAEARRKSIYLAAYIEPTRAETARYPKRGLLLGLAALFLVLAWSIATLIFYSIRDRR